jgi:hypothetical protein
MEYNDLIIIILLVVLIMTILFKYDVVGSNNLKANYNNEKQQNLDNSYYNREQLNINKKKILSNPHEFDNHIPNMSNIDTRLITSSNRNNKTYRNKLSEIESEVENQTENTNMYDSDRHVYVENKTKNKNKSILKKSSNKQMPSEIANSIYNKQNIKSNNKKVIIDDYSEMENIKSLNSMDNTLSDIMSTL